MNMVRQQLITMSPDYYTPTAYSQDNDLLTMKNC